MSRQSLRLSTLRNKIVKDKYKYKYVDEYNVDEYKFFLHKKGIVSCDYYDRDGSCIMITDLKNSTSLWAEFPETTHNQILLHNYILRTGINKLMCKMGNRVPNDIFKINEIGDSWEIVITGPNRFMKMYWLITFILKNYVIGSKKPKIRIGVSSGPNILYNNNGMFNWNINDQDKLIRGNKVIHSEQGKIGYDEYMKAKNLEQIAGSKDEGDENFKDISAIALSVCFFRGLLNDINNINNINNINDDIINYITKLINKVNFEDNIDEEIGSKNIDAISAIVDKELELFVQDIIKQSSEDYKKYTKLNKTLEKGYIIFIQIKKEIKDTFVNAIKKCNNNKSFPEIISIENAGLVYNLYSEENLQCIENLLQCINGFNDKHKVKMSIVKGNIIYNIHDRPTYSIDTNIYSLCNTELPQTTIDEYEHQQTFKRYISHSQNIAARILFAKLAKNSTNTFKTEFGRVYSNTNEIFKNKGLTNKDIQFKGLKESINVYSIEL